MSKQLVNQYLIDNYPLKSGFELQRGLIDELGIRYSITHINHLAGDLGLKKTYKRGSKSNFNKRYFPDKAITQVDMQNNYKIILNPSDKPDIKDLH